MKLVKHAIYPQKNIPNEALDKFFRHGWDELPPEADIISKEAFKTKTLERDLLEAVDTGKQELIKKARSKLPEPIIIIEEPLIDPVIDPIKK